MNIKVEAAAEALIEIDERIEQVKAEMDRALSGREYQELLDAKVDLLRERQEAVERLEELGLEDPDL